MHDDGASTSQGTSRTDENSIDSDGNPVPKSTEISDNGHVLLNVGKPKGVKGGKKGRRYIIVVQSNSNACVYGSALFLVACMVIGMVAIVVRFGLGVGRKASNPSTVDSPKRPGIGTPEVKSFGSCSALLEQVPADVAIRTVNLNFATISEFQWTDAASSWDSLDSQIRKQKGPQVLRLQDKRVQPVSSDGQGQQQSTATVDAEYDILVKSEDGMHMYAAVGQALVIVQTTALSSSPSTTQMPLFPDTMDTTLRNQTMMPIDNGNSYEEPYGIAATFRASRLMLIRNSNLLVVFGHSIQGSGLTDSANSPRTRPSSIRPNDKDSYYSSSGLRLFVSTTILFFDVTEPTVPVFKAFTELAGTLTAASASSDYLNVAVVAPIADPYTQTEPDEEYSDGHIMPVFRNGDRAGFDSLPIWTQVGSCTDVSYLSIRGAPVHVKHRRLLTAVALSLDSEKLGSATTEDMVHTLVAFDPEVDSVILTGDGLFTVESISDTSRSASSVTSSSSSSESSLSSQSQVYTIVMGWRFTPAADIRWQKLTQIINQEGELAFRGALSYDKEASRLAVLSSKELDSKYLSSTLTFYHRNMTNMTSITNLSPNAKPTSIHFASQPYSSDLQKRHAYITHEAASNPQVAVLSLKIENNVVVVARGYKRDIKEDVKLITTVYSHNNAEYLLVVGNSLASGPGVESSAPSPQTASSSLSGDLRMSIYRIDDLPLLSEPALKSEVISTRAADSEAFLDPNAALVMATSISPFETYFALPLTVKARPSDNCNSTDLIPADGASNFSGVVLWKFTWSNSAKAAQVEISRSGYISHLDSAGSTCGAPCPSAKFQRLNYIQAKGNKAFGDQFVLTSASKVSVIKRSDWVTTAANESTIQPLVSTRVTLPINSTAPLFTGYDHGDTKAGLPARWSQSRADSCKTEDAQCCLLL